MADQWYFSHGEQEFGPFLAARLKDLAAAGRLLPSDDVWKDGAGRRVVAAKVKGLFHQPQARARTDTVVALIAEVPAPAAPEGFPTPVPPIPSALSREPVLSAMPIRTDVIAAKLAGRDQRGAPPEQIQKLRVIAIRGAVIVSQDGRMASYKKKCINCGYEDPNRTMLQIRRGINRVSFFCPDCRKTRTAEIQGVR